MMGVVSEGDIEACIFHNKVITCFNDGHVF